MGKMVSSSPSAEESLDALESTVNALLLQTGNILSDPANLDNRRLLRTSTTIKQHVPPAVERVQQALASLERELGVAKVILLRDLEEQRALNNKPKSPALRANATQLTMSTEDGKGATGEQTSGPQIKQNSSPKAMTIDSPQATIDNKQVSDLKYGEETQHMAIQSDSDSPMDLNDTAISRNTESGVRLVANSSPTNIPDDDVDSVIGPEESNPTNNGLNIDFGENSAGNLPNGTASAGALPNQPATSTNFAQRGVGSLLPGLEIYANDDGQDPLGDIPDMDSFSTPNAFRGNGENKNSMKTVEQEEFNTNGLGEGSTFEDLFDFGDFGGTDDSASNGVLATFDDSQFNADFFNI